LLKLKEQAVKSFHRNRRVTGTVSLTDVLTLIEARADELDAAAVGELKALLEQMRDDPARRQLEDERE